MESQSFERISVKEGLSQVSVYSIVQDQCGFMWFGTDDGLNRYDGYEIEIYRYSSQDSLSINNNTINALFVSQYGNLWVGTNQGLNLFGPKLDGFIHYEFDYKDTTSLSGKVVWCIMEDAQGELWVGTNNGLNKYNRETNSFTRYKFKLDDPNSLSNNSINTMILDGENRMLLGTNKGVNRYDALIDKFDRISPTGSNTEKYSGGDVIQSFVLADEGKVFLGTNKGLYTLEGDTIKRYRNKFVKRQKVSVMHKDTYGNIWVGTENGIARFMKEKNKWVRYIHNVDKLKSLSNNNITTIFEDETGIVWIGTYSGGVNKYYKEQQQFVHFQKNNSDFRRLPSDKVLSMMEQDNKFLYIGTSNGLAKLNLDNFKLEKEKLLDLINDDRDPSISAIEQMPNDYLAIGTNGQGLFFYNRKDEKIEHIMNVPGDSVGITDNKITSLLYAHNYLWIGTEGGGLLRYSFHNKTFNSFKYDPSNDLTIKSNNISTIEKGNDGEIWIGTTTAGVFRLKTGSRVFEQFENNPLEDNGLSDNYVLSLNYIAGTLWVGTRGGGLDKFEVKENVWTNYNVDNGLSNNVVYNIVRDADQSLWLTTNKGVSVFNPEHISFINYDEVDGLGNQTFNRGCGLLTSKNQLFFGGIQGIDLINYQEIQQNQIPPTVVFTELEVFNADSNAYEEDFIEGLLSEVDKFVLEPEHNLINIGFSALSYRQPEKNQYAYRIKGLYDEWTYIGNRHYVTLSNLPPGSYTLQVKASNNEAVWNEKPEEISFVKMPKFYEESWFKFLVVIGVISLAYLFYILRVNRERKYSKMLEDKVETRTKIIAQERDEKALLLKEIHHRVKNNLQIINSLLRLQSHFVTDEEALWALNESQSRVMSMADIHEKMYKTDNLADVNIEEYFNELGARLISTYDLKDSIESDILISVKNLNLDTLTPLGLIMNEIITNSLKYGFPDHRKGVIKIHLERLKNQNKFRLVIGDNGIGLPEGELFGTEMSMGSQLIIGLSDQLNGELKRLPEQGTVYELVFEEINK